MPNNKVEVTFFISPHPDDWQLFMVPRAYSDLCWPKDQCKVVFIYLTAGDAGKIGVGDEFWRGREMGSLNAVRSLRGLPPDVTIPSTVETVCGHQITTYKMLDNTVSYYLRLPEASMFQRPSSPTASPPAAAKLEPLGQTVAPAAQYQNWNDLVGTVAQILRNEAYGAEIRTASWVNYVDPRDAQHLNHAVAGYCIEDAMALTGTDKNADKVSFAPERFVDYKISGFPKNVAGDLLRLKTAMFQTYDTVANDVSKNRYGGHQFGDYLEWLERQYTVDEAKRAGLL